MKKKKTYTEDEMQAICSLVLNRAMRELEPSLILIAKTAFAELVRDLQCQQEKTLAN